MFKSILILLISSSLVFSQNYIDKTFNNTNLKTASVALLVYDINNNKQVYAHNQNKSLKPASNLKILTTAAILETLGANYQFTTYLKYSGKIENNILNGNLYIIGGGDPTLGSELFYDKQTQFLDNWINDLKKLNIKAIKGNIIVVDTLFKKQAIPSTWVWGDIGNYYGAGVSSISIFDNQYKLYYNTKVPIGENVKLIKTYPPINCSIENNVTAEKITRDKSNVYSSPFCNISLIQGSLPANKDTFIVKAAIMEPAKNIGEFFLHFLNKNKIYAKKSNLQIVDNANEIPDTNLILISEIKSPKLIDIINKTNKKSINLYAETLLRHLSLSRNKDGSNATGTSVLKYYWKNRGVDITGLNLYDGSGLSSYNLITAQQIVDVLKKVYTDSLKYQGFISTLPVAGESGTLKYFLYKSEAKKHIYAKSGSMSGVKAYSGYIETKQKNILTFSFIINNFTCSSSKVRKDMENILLYIYSNY